MVPPLVRARVAALLVVATLAGAVSGQPTRPGATPVEGQTPFGAPAPVVEWTAAQLKSSGVQFVRKGESGPIVEVHWRDAQVPLKEPTADCAVGATPGGQLVLLAGGVRTSLDLYLIEPDGQYHRYATEGGHRLPRSFNDGRGSWPLVEGRHLVLFAFAKSGKREFRALGFDGRVQASRQLPEAVDGFSVRSDPDRGAVRVLFGGIDDPLEFRHPLAPRLQLSRGLVEFGTVEIGSSSGQLLYLKNTGRRPLQLQIAAVPEGFAVVGRHTITLAEGERHRLQIRFDPNRSGAFDARLKIVATGVIPEHLIVLRGAGESSAAARQRVEPPKPAAVVSPPPVAPRVSDVEFYPDGGGRVLVMGRIDSAARRVAIGGVGAERVIEVDADGRFHARVAVAAGAVVQLAALADDDRRSGFTKVGNAPAMLELRGGKAFIHCLPDQRFVLVARSDGKVVRSWRARADGRGRCALPLTMLGPPGTARLKLTVVTGVGRAARLSAEVEVPGAGR